jgi:hypothetical protein
MVGKAVAEAEGTVVEAGSEAEEGGANGSGGTVVCAKTTRITGEKKKTLKKCFPTPRIAKQKKKE